MSKDNTVYLLHIMDAINQIEEYVKGLDYESFNHTRLVQDGVIRQFEIIGEATKNLPPEIKNCHPHVPWKDIAGMRDKLIHQYFGVDIAAVWETVTQDIPSLKNDMARILASLPRVEGQPRR